MDREIPKQKLKQRQRRRFLLGGAIAALAAGAVIAIGSLTEESVNIADIKLSAADRGDIDAAVNGNGTIVAAFEEVIVSPVNSRILEVYHHNGDIVEEGTPLLKLDLGEASTREASERDELAMMRLDHQRLQASHRTRLSDLRMQIKVAEMKLRRQEVEVANERHLDSIGSGTTDRVREAEFALRTQRLELEQLREQLANEQRMLQAEDDAKLLEISIKRTTLPRQAAYWPMPRYVRRAGPPSPPYPTASAPLSAKDSRWRSSPTWVITGWTLPSPKAVPRK